MDSGSIETIGIDWRAPYGIYLNGQSIAIYDEKEKAEQHYQQLLQQLNNQYEFAA
tara:strand:+ start:1276 stop:1440 length:165 start_codon:yes stop_codon:yes gene_type:complete